MINKLFTIFCFLIIKSGFSQDTFTYKTVNASNTKDRVVQLEEPDERITGALSTTSREGGTATNGILGALSVSPTGAANYTIPIDVPPGLNGVAPKISLTFNSQSGPGNAGWGWNLSGISSITRIPSTQYHDNKIDPVDFDLLDRFALDGQRLILRTGSYGANGAVYQTEKYSNIKIVSYGSHPTSGVQGPRYFKIFYPDGSIAHYGYNDDSRSPVDYAISYWENLQGIRVNYSYVKDTINSLNISRITYGSRGAAIPINEIEFLYVSKRRNEISYINRLRFKRTKILKSINVKGNGVSYRNYALGYLLNGHSFTSLDYHRLRYVREYTRDNSLYKDVSFTYGRSLPFGTHQIEESENTFNQLNLSNIEQRNAKVLTLDISGDGKMDFIVYPTTGGDAKNKFCLFNCFQLGNVSWATEVNTGVFEDVFQANAKDF